MNLIVMENVSKSFRRYNKKEGLFNNFFNREYENILAVSDVSFSIEEGEIVGLLGPNGAGKTTIMKILTGLIMPSDGKVRVLDSNPFDKKQEFKKQISLVLGQKQQLWWDIPAIESFELNRRIYGIDSQQYKRVLDELVEMLSLKDLINSPVRTLSLGERMKCELAAALLHSPKVLFLDEPTIGLDVIAQKKVRDFIKEYNKKFKACVIITSHYMEDIEELCDRTIFINNGLKYYDGNFYDFLNLYGKECILNIELIDNAKEFDLHNYGAVVKSAENRYKLKVSKEKSNEIRKKILAYDVVNTVTIDQMDASDIVRGYFEKGNSKNA
jgi:ABC-2 type transport system ATP-binding protein